MKCAWTLVTMALVTIAAGGAAAAPGAIVGKNGFATILQVPPSPTGDIKSKRPTYNGPIEFYAQEADVTIDEARKRISEQLSFEPIFRRLQERLRRIEPDNYISARINHKPDWSYTLFFKRDPEATLRKYHVNPRFNAAKGDYTPVEIQAIVGQWTQRFARAKLFGVMIFPFESRIEMSLPVTEREFRAIAAREQWVELPAPIHLSFARDMAVPRVDPRAIRFLRGFASESIGTTLQLERGESGRVILDDGCLRLAGRGKVKGPLVVFHRETGIGLDAQGYLATINRDSGKATGRIGEEMSWAGPNPGIEFDGLTELKAKCGDGPITNIGNPESTARFDARYRR